MNIIIGRPQSWINRSKSRDSKIWFHDVEALYDNIEIACKNLDIDYTVRHIEPGTVPKVPNGSIYLSHHTYGEYENVWHIKKGYVPGYLYFDKLGYSGWSSIADNSEENFDKLQGYYNTLKPKDLIDTKNITDELISNNESKIKQPNTAEIPEENYVLVLGQRPHDTVSRLAYIQTVELAKLVNKVYKDSDISVYTKPHPMSLKTNYYGKKIEGSLHRLISNAKIIYTVNSGSGFESLFHNKHVFVSGKCDYHWGCTGILTNEKDIEISKDYMDTPRYSKPILNFLCYAFNEYFVNAYDLKSVEKKIKRVISEI